MPRSQRPRALTPTQQASEFYGPAFDHTDEEARDAAAGDWFDSHASDQRFVIAHLLFLMLFALEGIRRAVLDLRDRSDDMVTLLETELEEAKATSEPTEPPSELPEPFIEPLDVEPAEASNREPELPDEGGDA